jgi:hypothetical protein
MTYNQYLQSDHWKNVKYRYWKSGLIKCCGVCGAKENLDLHHKSYKRIGNERLSDLIPLCRTHHYELHEKLKAYTGTHEIMWSMVAKMRKQYWKNKKYKK